MADIEESTGSRKLVITKFVLAGVAVVGVGAAVTSAAWTDDVWFTADATAASIDLVGSVDYDPVADLADPDAATWEDADTEGTAIEIPVDVFEGLVPGDSRETTVYLRNNGTVPLEVSAATITYSGALFDGTLDLDGATSTTDDIPTVTVVGTPETALPYATAADAANILPVTVTITTDANWVNAYQGQLGTVTLQFTGSTS
jgi:predicted ribosomally synthesized peptide with SipW-like signal peptide